MRSGAAVPQSSSPAKACFSLNCPMILFMPGSRDPTGFERTGVFFKDYGGCMYLKATAFTCTRAANTGISRTTLPGQR
mgnify:CR=1 FL=1